MDSLSEDIVASASWVSNALQSNHYNADFSFASISEVERFFAEQTKDGAAIPSGLLSEELGPRLFALGCYCGEVVRREIGGVWLTDDDDPEGEINAALQFASGALCWPIQRAMKRFAGSENNLVHWADWLRESEVSKKQ